MDSSSENVEQQSVVKLEKYPQSPIEVTVANEERLLQLLNKKQEGVETRASQLVKDSIWSNGSGHSLIYETNEFSVTYDVMRYIYLGSLLKAGSIENQRFQQLPNQVEPINISYSFPGKWVIDTIDRPSLGAQRQAVQNALRKEGMSGSQLISFSYDMNQFSYYNEIKLAFGCNINVAKVFNLGVDVSKEKVKKNTGLIAKFIQKNFTVDMDLPLDGNILLNHSDMSNVGTFDPVYISSIVYGRMGVIIIETNESYENVRVAVKAAFEAKIVSGELNLSYEHKQILEKCDIKLSVTSGDGKGAVKAISGFEEFKKFIIGGGTFSQDVPGDPLFYTASYLSDNSPLYSRFKIDLPQ
ncbi:MAG: thiol-activated cytolysin family protein [Lachnospiraceae bacterium]